MTFINEYFDDGAVIRYGGRTTGKDILEAKRQFFSHAFAAAARYLLCDFTLVDQFDVNAADVQKIVRQDLDALSTHPVLAEVVIAPKPHQFGLARMWEEQVTDERPLTHVASSRDAAIGWLKAQDIVVGNPKLRPGS